MGIEKGRDASEKTMGKKKIDKALFDDLNKYADSLGWELDFSSSGTKKLENGQLSIKQLQTLRDAKDAQEKLIQSCFKVVKDDKLKTWDQFSNLKGGMKDLNKNKVRHFYNNIVL